MPQGKGTYGKKVGRPPEETSEAKKTTFYSKAGPFKMTGSPHKTGVIEGTSGHASALKHRTGIFGMFDKFRGRQDEQRAKNQALLAKNKEAERQANMENPSTPNRPAPAAAAPITPIAPTVDPNAPMGSEGAIQPDPEELGTA